MKIYIKTKCYKEFCYNFMGITWLKIIKKEGSKSSSKHKDYFFPVLTKKEKNKYQGPVFYLKVNRICGYTYICLQNWIDIIKESNANFYIVCDKKELKKQILKRVKFYSPDVKFIKSDTAASKSFINTLVDPCWIKAGNAHLTTFLNATKNNYPSFWNIDADDTLFLIPPSKMAKILANVANYAEKNNLNNFSLDMWCSRTLGKAWSFGVTYSKLNIDYIKEFKEEKKNWRQYVDDEIVSLDSYFGYQRNVNGQRNETFYIEDSQFIHFFDHFMMPFALYHWKDKILSFPIFEKIYKNEEFAKTSIADSCISFSLPVTAEEIDAFIQEKFVYRWNDEVMSNFRKLFKGK